MGKKTDKKIRDGVGYFLQALQIMGIVSQWAVAALEDEIVTMTEGAQLIEDICRILGVKAELNIKS